MDHKCLCFVILLIVYGKAELNNDMVDFEPIDTEIESEMKIKKIEIESETEMENTSNDIKNEYDEDYNHLLQMIQPIIPSTYQNQTNPSNSDTNEGIVRGILGTAREMIDKIDDPQRQADLRKVLVKGRGLLNPQHQYEGLRSSASHRIKDEDRDELLKEFTGILKAPAENVNSMAKAPFSKLGEDTFEDVDHQILAMEIKRLAITLKEYLQSRMKEGNEEKSEEYESDDEPLSRNEFYRDSVLAQMTLQLAKLHRAVLKNHHHLLILIGNFAGNAKNAREHKGNNETGNVKD